jgi:subtilisin family serine protease
VGRRLLAAGLLALCLTGAASAAPAAGSADPLQTQEWWLPAIGADTVASPGPGVPITIVDSGVDPTHPEFAGRANTTFLNTQSVVGREEYHGTIVASVAAAPANGVGIVGVYPDAVLRVVDASPDPRGIADSTAVTGILAAAAQCPGVINLSFGSVLQDDFLRDAILTAVRNGCLVVAAAGNGGEEGSPPTYPAAWPHVLTVAAADENAQIVAFSTTGPSVDLAAPGVDIVGAVPLSRDPTGYQDGFEGTSFAAPIVAAAAAWIWTARPTLSAGQLADVLRRSARDIGPVGFDTAGGWGVVDIPAALALAPPAADPAEPNDDVNQVKPGRLFAAGESPLTTPARPSIRVSASIDASEDPRDVYRIWVPAHRTVRVQVNAGGRAAARIWGPETNSIDEKLAGRRRDLRGPRVRAGKHGFPAYVEVLLTGRSPSASYVLAVTAAKR